MLTIGAQRNEKSDRWVFTWNNYQNTETWKEVLDDFFEKINTIYYIYGKEIAPETGTPHLQGYFRTNKKLYRATIRSYNLPIWIDRAKGSEKECIDYCAKGGNYIEWGTLKSRSRMKAEEEKKNWWIIYQKDLCNLNIEEFERKYPGQAFQWIQKNDRWRLDHLEPCNWDGDLKKKNYWVWGPTRTGKSRWAHTQCPASQFYFKMFNKWWGGYKPGMHKIVGIEDYPNDCNFMGQFMKIWADRYAFQGEIKGSSMLISPAYYILIVTSNYSIEECFSEGDIDAIKARFTEIHIERPDDIFLMTKLDQSILTKPKWGTTEEMEYDEEVRIIEPTPSNDTSVSADNADLAQFDEDDRNDEYFQEGHNDSTQEIIDDLKEMTSDDDSIEDDSDTCDGGGPRSETN